MATNRRGRATRQNVLDAGERLLAARGADLTMEDVANEAGVTRTTVYRHVANRDELLTAVVLRTSARLAEQLAAILDGPGPFADRVVESVVLIVGAVRDTPHLRAVVSLPDPGRRWTQIDSSNAFLDAVWAFFRPRVQRAVDEEGVELRATVDRTIDWLLRQALLAMLVPSIAGDDDDALRDELRTFVVPAVFAGAGRAAGVPVGRRRAAT
jgi:AcrR family transcriptional regulator